MDASGKGQIKRIQPAYVSTYDGGIQFTPQDHQPPEQRRRSNSARVEWAVGDKRITEYDESQIANHNSPCRGGGLFLFG